MYYIIIALSIILLAPQAQAAICGDARIDLPEMCDKSLGDTGCPQDFFCNKNCKCEQCMPTGNSPSRNHFFNKQTCSWECQQKTCKYPQFFNQQTCSCECTQSGRPPNFLYRFNAKTCKWECPESIFCPAGNIFNKPSCTCEPNQQTQQAAKKKYTRIVGKTIFELKKQTIKSNTKS